MTTNTKGKTVVNFNSLTLKGCYGFRVKAYRASDKTYSAYSSVSRRYIKCITPKLSSTTKGKLKVSWSKVSGATGYEVQYSTRADMSGKKTVKVTSVSTVTKTPSLSSGTTYYVRIRPYKTVNGKTYNGIYSSVQVQTVK